MYFDYFSQFSQINESAIAICLTASNFLETLANMGFEYLIIDTIYRDRGVEMINWLMLQIYNVYNYHSILNLDETPEKKEKMLEVKINRIENLDRRAAQLTEFIQNSACLRKYAMNRATQSAHSFLRILLKIIEKDLSEYNSILSEVKFGFFFANLSQKQYSLLQLFIRTKTENLHVIGVSLALILEIR